MYRSIVVQINAGKLTDIIAAVVHIDSILSPTEVKTVLAMQMHARSAMRESIGTPPDGAPPKNYPVAGEEMGGGHLKSMNMNDAGFYLLRLSLTHEQMRAMMMQSMHDSK